MPMSWKLGRVAGIDLYLHPTFLILLALLATSRPDTLLLTMTAFGCVVLHELGHALMARRYGIETEDITLYPIGGVARLARMPRAAGAELLIALAGPAVNVAIATTLFVFGGIGLFSESAVLTQFAGQLLLVNVVLAVFNLLPAFPMDGGRVLRALLSGWLGRRRATAIAAGIGRVLAVAFGAYCLANGMLPQAALALFIYFAAGAELARVENEEDRRDQGGDRFDGETSGIWVCPPGYRWINRGDGVWQLSPVLVDTGQGKAPRWR
ncbi:MAG: site-2 protease family protein [Isosphaeraceae bacterium]